MAFVAGLGCPAFAAPAEQELATSLSRAGFNGAVVIRGVKGVRFSRGFGLADPFSGRGFTVDTPVDSASLAKPVTATIVLKLAKAGKLDLDAPAKQYIAEFPYEQVTGRQLLSHSAGLPVEEMIEPLAGQSNAGLLREMTKRKLPTLFPPGSAFVYCNLCYMALAELAERASGKHYLDLARQYALLPPSVIVRPAALSDWKGRAIGFRLGDSGRPERADSYENEIFYGSANLSISASQLARWGSEWWKDGLAPIRNQATTPAVIDGKTSGLTLGNWYCATSRHRCHYLGHHEGFHHMLYWDLDRKLSIAMVTNNSLSPAIQQRVQRALVAFAEGRRGDVQRELQAPMPDTDVEPGTYRLPSGEPVEVLTKGTRVAVKRGGINYLAFRVGKGIRYVPGLDLYVSGAGPRGMHWLSLYEDLLAQRSAA